MAGVGHPRYGSFTVKNEHAWKVLCGKFGCSISPQGKNTLICRIVVNVTAMMKTSEWKSSFFMLEL